MADMISEVAMSGSGSESCDIDCGQPQLNGTPNGATDTRALALVLSVGVLSGGTTPAVTMTTSRYEQDGSGNPTGVVTAIDTPAGLTAIGAQSRTIGPNQAQAASLNRRAKIAVVVSGAPTACQWSVQAVMTR